MARRTAALAAIIAAFAGAAATATAAPAADDGRAFELISKSLPPGRQAVAMAPVVAPGAIRVLYNASASDGDSTGGRPPLWAARLEPSGWVDRQVAVPGPQVVGALETVYGQYPNGDPLLMSRRPLDPAGSTDGGFYRVDPVTLAARQVMRRVEPNPLIGTIPAAGPLPLRTNVALTPEAEPLDGNAIKAYRLDARGLELASVLPDGRPAPAQVTVPADTSFFAGPLAPPADAFGQLPIAEGRRHGASADGRRVFFTAGDFTVNTPGTAGALYRNDADTGTVGISASQRTLDPGTLSTAIFNGASADGDVVFFSAAKPLTDGVDGPGLYRYVVSTRTLTRLTPGLPPSTDEPPSPTNTQPTLPLDVRSGWVSGDGSTIVFVATNAFTADAVEGSGNAYAWRAGELRFVGDLGQDGLVERISRDGDFAILTSTADVAGASAGGFPQVFRYDWPRDRVRCASCRADGSANAGKADVDNNQSPGLTPPVLTSPRGLTDDGRVFFTSSDRLVTQDPSGDEDAYEFTDDGVRLLSTGEGRSFVMDNSDDGASVFVSSSAALTGEDRDGGDFDLYVRRAGATPYAPPVTSAPCAGDACQGASSAPSAGVPAPGSDRVGGGNVSQPAGPALIGAPRVTTGLRRALRRGRPGRVPIRLRGPGRLRLTAVAGDRVVARGGVRITRTGARTVRVTLRPSRTGRRVLRRQGRLRIRVVATLGASRRVAVLTLRRGSR